MQLTAKEPVWIGTKYDGTIAEIPFKELLHTCDKLKQLALIWDCNSYLINIEDRYFVVNGGRRLAIRDDLRDIKLIYRRRKRAVLKMNEIGRTPDQDRKPETFYLLGISGKNGSDIPQHILLQISECGQFFIWQDKL